MLNFSYCILELNWPENTVTQYHSSTYVQDIFLLGWEHQYLSSIFNNSLGTIIPLAVRSKKCGKQLLSTQLEWENVEELSWEICGVPQAVQTRISPFRVRLMTPFLKSEQTCKSPMLGQNYLAG